VLCACVVREGVRLGGLRGACVCGFCVMGVYGYCVGSLVGRFCVGGLSGEICGVGRLILCGEFVGGVVGAEVCYGSVKW